MLLHPALHPTTHLRLRRRRRWGRGLPVALLLLLAVVLRRRGRRRREARAAAHPGTAHVGSGLTRVVGRRLATRRTEASSRSRRRSAGRLARCRRWGRGRARRTHALRCTRRSPSWRRRRRRHARALRALRRTRNGRRRRHAGIPTGGGIGSISASGHLTHLGLAHHLRLPHRSTHGRWLPILRRTRWLAVLGLLSRLGVRRRTARRHPLRSGRRRRERRAREWSTWARARAVAALPRVLLHRLIDEVVDGAFELASHLLERLPQDIATLEGARALLVRISAHWWPVTSYRLGSSSRLPSSPARRASGSAARCSS